MATILLPLLFSLYHGAAVALGLPQSAVANAIGDSGDMSAPQLLRKEVAAVIDNDKDVLDTIDESMSADVPDSSIKHPSKKKSTDFLLSDDDDPLLTANAMDDFEKWTEEYSAESSEDVERIDRDSTVTKGQAPRRQASEIPAVLAADSSNWPQLQQISAGDSLANSIKSQRQAPIYGRMPSPYEATNSHALKLSSAIASSRPVATPKVRSFVSRPSGLQAEDQSPSRAALPQMQDKQSASINGNRASEKGHNSRVMDEASLVDEDPVVKRAYMEAEHAAQEAAAAQERAETAAQQVDQDQQAVKAHADQAIIDEESLE